MKSIRRSKIFAGIPVALFVCFSFSAWPQESEAEPEDTFEHVQLWRIDDSHRVPSFAEFKRDLLRAAETSDEKLVTSTTRVVRKLHKEARVT